MANFKLASNGLTFGATGVGTEADPTIPKVSIAGSGGVPVDVNIANVGGNNVSLTVPVAGWIAAGLADSGAPVKIGAVYLTPQVAVDSGDRTNVQSDQYGNLNANDMTRNPIDDGVFGAAVVSKAVAVTTSGAYVANDVVGGIVSVTTVNYETTRRISLRSLQFNTKMTAGVGFNVYFFSVTPSGGTYTDNAGLVWDAADSAKKVGQLKLAAGDFLGDGTTVQASANYSGLDMVMPVGATTLFMLIVAQGAATLANGDLTMQMLFNAE